MNKQVDTLSHLATMRRDLARIAAAPDEAPVGPPGRFYTDNAYFAHECATVLRRGWHCVGRSDEVAETGAYLTLQLLGEPLIIVRDSGGIRALSNLCRHRGMPLAQGSGKAKRFVCPYHAWIYGTDGRLLRAARMENAGFDPDSCRLASFPCIERFGFVYVSLSDTPSDIDADLAGLESVIGPYAPQQFRIRHTATEIWHTNWKCLVENFMEGYHLSVVHPVTLHGYTPTALSKKGAAGRGFTSYFANYPHDTPSRGMGAPGLSPEARHRSSLFAAFPCQVASIAASLLVSLSLRPLTVGSVEVRWTLSTYGDDLDDEAVAERIALWEEVNREDREKLEAMQLGLGSIFATGGPLAGEDYEGTVRDFIQWQAREDASLLAEPLDR
ncbi:MAG: aromatic ring-hydroxylating dioxygenase subunit alpha [Pseudomonadota bacterium]